MHLRKSLRNCFLVFMPLSFSLCFGNWISNENDIYAIKGNFLLIKVSERMKTITNTSVRFEQIHI
jgi:hypothetical protein